jgi:hypothetical protein
MSRTSSRSGRYHPALMRPFDHRSLTTLNERYRSEQGTAAPDEPLLTESPGDRRHPRQRPRSATTPRRSSIRAGAASRRRPRTGRPPGPRSAHTPPRSLRRTRSFRSRDEADADHVAPTTSECPDVCVDVDTPGDGGHRRPFDADGDVTLTTHQRDGADHERCDDAREGPDRTITVRRIVSDVVQVDGHRNEDQTREDGARASHYEEEVTPFVWSEDLRNQCHTRREWSGRPHLGDGTP